MRSMVEGARRERLVFPILIRGESVPPPPPLNSAVAEFSIDNCPSRVNPTWVAVPLPRCAGEESRCLVARYGARSVCDMTDPLLKKKKGSPAGVIRGPGSSPYLWVDQYLSASACRFCIT